MAKFRKCCSALGRLGTYKWKLAQSGKIWVPVYPDQEKIRSMNHIIYRLIYGKSFSSIIIAILAGILVWGTAGLFARKTVHARRLWRTVNLCLAVAYGLFILYFTVLSRQKNVSALQLIPFHSFIEARIQPEMYRTMLMNVFLFVPVGLTLPFALPERTRRKVLISVLGAFLLSAAVEVLQFVFHLGRAETDDVICNTLGAAFGTLAYSFNRRK